MTVASLIIATGVGIAALCGYHLRDLYAKYAFLSMFGAVIGGSAAVGAAIWMLSLHYQRATCHSWAQKTGRETRFAYYNAFNWECLARAHDGKWVPKSQIGDFNK